GFEVDFSTARPIDRLVLNGIPAPFLKRFLLEGSGDRSHWTVLVAEGTLFDLPDEDLRQTEVAFPAGEYRYLRVTSNDLESGLVPPPLTAQARGERSCRRGKGPQADLGAPRPLPTYTLQIVPDSTQITLVTLPESNF